MGDETTVDEAKTNPPPGAEAVTPAGPTVADLQAKIADWEIRYGKEVGDREKGLVRQSKELKDLNDRLLAAERAAEALAKRTFGVEDVATEETEYEKWQRERKVPASQNPPPVANPDQLLASGKMIALAELYGVDYESPPAELAATIKEMTTLYYSDNPDDAVKKWKSALKKRDDEIKTKADIEQKAKKVEVEKISRLGVRDTSTSTGGGTGTYADIAAAWMKDPNNPVIKQRYLEARQARGV